MKVEKGEELVCCSEIIILFPGIMNTLMPLSTNIRDYDASIRGGQTLQRQPEA